MTLVLCFISFIVGATFAFLVIALLCANEEPHKWKWWNE